MLPEFTFLLHPYSLSFCLSYKAHTLDDIIVSKRHLLFSVQATTGSEAMCLLLFFGQMIQMHV